MHAKYLVQRILWHTVSSWYKRRQQGGGAKKKRKEEEMLWEKWLSETENTDSKESMVSLAPPVTWTTLLSWNLLSHLFQTVIAKSSLAASKTVNS